MVGRPRKAKVDAEARSMAEPSSEISLPENDDDSDFEEPPVVTKGRKRQKRGDGPAPKRGGGGGRGRGRKKSGGGGGAAVGGGADDDADSGTGSIFDVVKGGRSSLQSLVDDWIESYKNDRDSALLELIQFFIQGSGCKGKITPYMYANQEHAEIIRRMTEEFDEESGDYPLIMSGPIWKRFRSNFCEFVQVLVRQCQYSIIYDQYMMDNIISLLTGLTDSQVRAFRHTSTLAAMKLMTALVDVALNLSINLDNTQRQYEAERQKQQMKRANDRLDMLLTRRQELEENQAEIRNMLTYIFRGVFVHRYRDTQPEIRSICMTEIGVWMKKYPNMFLDDAYLKYVGWTLYDKIGDVRQCCLRALYPLYETEDLSPKLELFTNRFKDRIVEMTLDKEYDVAVQGIRLVISILRYNDTILSDKDCENVYELVYSSNRQVAQAAGEFLNTKLFLRDYEGPKTLKIHKGKKQSLNAPLIRDLVQFFIESELHEHAAYLVDSLWDINDMMKDWDCMTDLLLDEPQKGEEPLDDRQETSLIEIMVCCVKQAATGESPVGRGHNRKLTAKETKNVSEDKTRLTEHFISTLPQLLLKYLMDPEKVANLLLVPQYFELDIYTASRQEKNLEALLRYLHEVVEKHTDTEVLEACSKCYECLCCEEYAIAGKCDVARKTLIDSLVVKFKEAMQDFFAEGEEPDEDEIFALTASLKRIYAFYSCHNLTSWDLWDDIFSIIKNGNENQTIPDEIVSKAMSSASMSVLWYLQKLDENNPSKDEMKALRKRLNDLLKYCHELMYHPKDRVNEEAFITICDLLIVFSKNMANNDMMKPLVYEPDKNLQQQLSNFLTDKVFVDDEDDDVDENVKIEELHKRRNFLACFCKLIVYNIVGIRVAADMFKHYMKFYNDYGDIIKATLSKAREINKVTTAKTLALSLTQLYREQFSDGGPIDRSSDSFQSLKELARRFALSFGLDAVKNREAVAAMHKEGILFSLSRPDDHRDHSGPPPYLTFLEILSEFTNKLMKPDRRVVLAYLDKNLPDGGISSTEDWQSLIAYRNSLLQGESEVHPVTLKQASARRYGKRKQMPDVSDHDSNTGDWQDHSAMTPAPGIGGPQLTSTAVKRRRMDEESLGGASEPGSEQDFEGSGSVQQMTQMSWLNAQKREHLEATYQRMKQAANIPPLESEGSEERSIGEFESPPQLLQQQYQQYQQGYYDNSSQNIEDGSHPQTPQAQVPAVQSDMSHPGF